jgi:GntR family transcriptional regulator, rspAB operon transcriptional repressor
MLLRDTIYQAIRDSILSCEFQPGQELREQALAERYRVSRSPVRDSLLRLELEKLVTVLPRQGYLVSPISRSDVDDVFSLRSLIEPACAAAAVQADAAALSTLDRFRGFAETQYTESGFIAYNTAFHCAVVELSGNMRMAGLVRTLISQIERVTWVALRDFRQEGVADVCAEHEAIIDALQAHDPERASRLCYEHGQGIHQLIVATLRSKAPQWEKTVAC